VRRSLLGLFALVLALCVALAVVGCGGGGHKKAAGGAGVCQAPSPSPPTYKPTGNLIADSGFRPETNGFGVENYANCGQVNLTPAAMAGLFGDQTVCLSGSGPSCQLDPSAQQWMATTNEQMGGGHCMGFSVTALRFFSGGLDPSKYGASSTFALDVAGNKDLQSLIAADWVYQFLPSVTGKELVGTPNGLLQVLVNSLKQAGQSNRSNAYPSAQNLYTIKIFNKQGGHAVTPYAVEDNGNGQYHVLIYDNNYPGITRAIPFDTNANTWTYNASTSPGVAEATYTGTASTKGTMALDPTGPGETTPQPFDFSNAPNTATGSVGSAGSTTLYNQISLLGDPTNHAHLILSDGKGHVTGFVHGQAVNQIPGVKVQQIASLDNWASTPEPNYLIPRNSPDITVLIDGTSLKKPDTEHLTLIGQGFYTEVQDIKLTPGQKDFIYFTGNGKGFVYRTAPNHDQSPTVASAIAVGTSAYAFAAKAIGVKGGSQLTMYIDPKIGGFVLDTKGTKGSIAKSGGYAAYVLSVVRETPNGSTTWVNGKTPILLKTNWQAIVDYKHAPAAGKDLIVHTGPEPGGGKSPIPIQLLPPQK
jgi:hypothetical protein